MKSASFDYFDSAQYRFAQDKRGLALSEHSESKGFTLVELLVVITILGILSVIGIAAYSGVQKNARDAKRKADLNKINTYLEAYRAGAGKYPTAGSCAYGSNCYVYSTTGEGWIPALVNGGITPRLPIDPINNANGPWVGGNYSYTYGNVTADGQTYDLTAQLENTNDSERCGLKNWKYNSSLRSTASDIWCAAFGGSYSNQIYEASPDR